MNKYEVLIGIGKLQIRFKDNPEFSDEIKKIQEQILENDLIHLAISYGRFSEMTKAIESDVSEEVDSIYNFIIDKEGRSDKKEKRLSIEEIKNLSRAEKLEMSIEQLGLKGRTQSILKRNRIQTVGELVEMSSEDLMEFKYLGPDTIRDVVKRLEEIELSLK